MDKFLGMEWKRIAISLFIILIAIILSAITKIIIDILTKRKYSIAGEYITKFEDCTAPAILKQKGRRVTGTTYVLEDNKKWTIEGEISKNGYIYGTYYSDDLIDKGTGTFFLKPDGKGNLQGMRAVYDFTNGKIMSGKYVLNAVNKSVKIIDLKKEYFPQLLDISDKELGKDYLSYETMDQVLRSNDEYICKLAVSRSDKKIIGFSLAQIITPDLLGSVLKLSDSQITRAMKHSERIGILKTTTVDTKYQGFGIGKELTQSCYKSLLRRKVQSVCSIAWKNGNKINMGGILSALGLIRYIEIENYWKEDSLENNYFCATCGKPPCKCSALIYTQSIFDK